MGKNSNRNQQKELQKNYKKQFEEIDRKKYRQDKANSLPETDSNKNATTVEKDTISINENIQLPVDEVIKRSNSGNELLNALKDRSDVGMFVASIKSYIEDITGRFRNNERMRAARNYSFYNILINLLNESDYTLFKRKMKILEKLFRIDRRFNLLELVKYDYYWTQGASTRDNYILLLTFLTEMTNPNNRKTAIKTIDISKLLEFISEQGIRNLTRYYNIEL